MTSRDIFRSWWTTGAVFGLPVLAIVASGFPVVPPGWRTATWVVALIVMGAGCVINALRCGRIHCYFTGPFFLIMAVAALLYGLGVLPLGKFGWNTISAVVLIGTLIFYCVPEMFAGRYRQERR